jgi:hypothetical protein
LINIFSNYKLQQENDGKGKVDFVKNIKVHAIVLALIIIAEMIGNVSFKIGVGTIVLLPMLYALIMGIFMAPKFLKVVNQKEICWMQAR